MVNRTDAMADKTAEVKNNLGDLGAMAVDVAKDHVAQVKETASDLYEQGTKKAKSMQKDAETYIKNEPIKTVLIAGAVGVVIGLLLAKR